MQMDETTIFSGPFIFISYSHKDAAIVREDVEKLINQGVRVWIDHRSEEEENLELSNNWFEKVKAAINHPNCCSVVFYVSKYSLASKAIFKEQSLVLQKAEMAKFPYYSVSVGGLKMAKHHIGAFTLCTDEDSAWYNEDYYCGEGDISSKQKSMFNDDKLYIARTDSDECVDQIIKKVAQPLGATDHRGALLSSLAKNAVASRDTGEITFGIYKGSSCEPVAHTVEDARFVLGGRHYIHHNGEFFYGRPLRWRVLYIRDAVAVLICTEIVEKAPACTAQNLLETFRDLAFTHSESSVVRCVRLMNGADEAQLDPEKKEQLLQLDDQQEQMYWWVDEDGIMPGWKLTYKNNVPARNGFLVSRPKGIRPVIEIAADDLKSMNGG